MTNVYKIIKNLGNKLNIIYQVEVSYMIKCEFFLVIKSYIILNHTIYIHNEL
jgi:hypothetical protein